MKDLDKDSMIGWNYIKNSVNDFVFPCLLLLLFAK